jgi:hypothetical protein
MADEIDPKEAPEQSPEVEQVEAAAPQPPDQAANDEPGQADEVEISIEGEAPTPEEEEQQRAPDWVRELRKADREKARRIRELEAKLGASAQVQTLGPEPDLSDPDIDFNKDLFKTRYAEWLQRKQDHEAIERKRAQEEQAAKAAWAETQATYAAEKMAIRVADFAEAEEAVVDGLTEAQQGFILHVAKKRAELVYAVGKSPKILRELAAISDPLKFAARLGEIQAAMKITPKRTAPPPETSPRGVSGVAMGADAKLAELEAEADRTGDRTKVAAYRRTLKQRQAA